MLDEIAVPDDICLPPLDQAAAELIQLAAARIERFTRSHRPRIDNFVVSDFPLVAAAVRWIAAENLACGPSFCEWGSGFGVVTMLASLFEFDAHGIEVETALVEQAEQLAEDQQIEVRFAQGSFIPDAGHQLIGLLGQTEHLEIDTPDGYHQLDAEISDFDLFFAFPWPGEQHVFEQIFERFAADGALLLTYQGIEQLRLQRKG